MQLHFLAIAVPIIFKFFAVTAIVTTTILELEYLYIRIFLTILHFIANVAYFIANVAYFIANVAYFIANVAYFIANVAYFNIFNVFVSFFGSPPLWHARFDRRFHECGTSLSA